MQTRCSRRPQKNREWGAVAVAGPAGQVGAFDGGPGTGAFGGCGVDDPHVVVPQVGVPGQGTDEPADQCVRGPQSFVVAGLAGQVRELGRQVGAGEAEPPGLGDEAEQGLHHRQRQQLGISQPRRAARSPSREGLEVCRHKRTNEALASCTRALRTYSSSPLPHAVGLARRAASTRCRTRRTVASAGVGAVGSRNRPPRAVVLVGGAPAATPRSRPATSPRPAPCTRRARGQGGGDGVGPRPGVDRTPLPESPADPGVLRAREAGQR